MQHQRKSCVPQNKRVTLLQFFWQQWDQPAVREPVGKRQRNACDQKVLVRGDPLKTRGKRTQIKKKSGKVLGASTALVTVEEAKGHRHEEQEARS
jgi:hypothetical protein